VGRKFCFFSSRNREKVFPFSLAATSGCRSCRVRILKTQFFFAYAIMGSIVPFLPIYLKREQGLTEGQVGLVLGLASVSILLTPVLMTLLADTRFDSRRLASVIFGVSAAAMLALFFAEGLWLVLALLCVHSLAYAAVVPLHDGMAFGLQRRMEAAGEPIVPYYHIRVCGTVGFILPSVIFFGFLTYGYSTSVILLGAVAFSTAALLNAFRLPAPRTEEARHQAAKRVPTRDAAAVFLRPGMRVFCVALFTTFVAAAAFGSFYPLYMVDVVGVEERWVGLIFNFGVVIEIFFMLGFGWLQARLGLRNIMVIGTACFALQAVTLGLFPNVFTAVAVQLLHGMIIVGIYMAPIMFINRQAGDHFRNSIQGLYTMMIMGLARIVGIIVAGQAADVNLRIIPFAAAALAACGASMLFVAFREQKIRYPGGTAEPVRDPSC